MNDFTTDFRILNYIPAAALTQDEIPPGFPLERWNRQLQQYTEMWRYFSGEYWQSILPHTQTETGDPVEQYPLQINPIRDIIFKHAAAMIGEIPDTDDSAVHFEGQYIQDIFSDDKVTEEQEGLALQIEDFLNAVWQENNGRAKQLENALIAPLLGGCYFKTGWWPKEEGISKGLTIDILIPDVVLPVWDTSNYNRLLEAFIAYRIPAREAKLKYGVEVKGLHAVYVEHWTEEDYSITIDGEPLQMRVGNIDISYNKQKNIYGFVPVTYIPWIRAGGFYGLSLIRGAIEGLSKEYNIRMADIGDGIQDTIHRKPWVRNTSAVTSMELPDGTEAHNLGFAQMGGADPEMEYPSSPEMSPGLIDFPEKLFRSILRSGFLSNIAYGEDEGSQRSALTLAFRMWPTTSIARIVRANWTVGLIQVCRQLLAIAALKYPVEQYRAKFADSLERVRLSVNWAPMIPRDREQVVNEVILLYSTGLLTIEQALTRLGDEKNPELAAKEVLEEARQKAQLKSSNGMGAGDTPTETPTGIIKPVPEAITGDG
jgi:hypothetical protein